MLRLWDEAIAWLVSRGQTALVGWYTSQGFAPSDTFTVGDHWHGQVFEMSL